MSRTTDVPRHKHYCTRYTLTTPMSDLLMEGCQLSIHMLGDHNFQFALRVSTQKTTPEGSMDEPVRPQCDAVGIRGASVLAWVRRVTLSTLCTQRE